MQLNLKVGEKALIVPESGWWLRVGTYSGDNCFRDVVEIVADRSQLVNLCHGRTKATVIKAIGEMTIQPNEVKCLLAWKGSFSNS